MSLFVAQDRVEFGGRLAAAFRQKASSALCPLPCPLILRSSGLQSKAELGGFPKTCTLNLWTYRFFPVRVYGSSLRQVAVQGEQIFVCSRRAEGAESRLFTRLLR